MIRYSKLFEPGLIGKMRLKNRSGVAKAV